MERFPLFLTPRSVVPLSNLYPEIINKTTLTVFVFYCKRVLLAQSKDAKCTFAYGLVLNSTPTRLPLSNLKSTQ